MKITNFVKAFICFGLIFSTVLPVAAQKRTAPTAPSKKLRPVIFAVLSDGKTLEPVAHLEKGALTATVGAGDEGLENFFKTYYQPNAVYRLIFGGAGAGTVTVKSADPKAECAPNVAQATWQSPKAKLKGMVMALATDAPLKTKGSGVRRLPTPAERLEIERLVRAEFVKNKISENVARNLKYHNLTALDADADGAAEMVGSFWVETAPTERALLFFIADKTTAGKYEFGFSEFKVAKQDDLMSGDIKNLDDGIGHELLLDIFDVDADGTAEVFTYVQTFEGANFHAFRRGADDKWTKIFENYNYHCAY